MEGVHVVKEGLGDFRSPAESRGKVPQKLKQNVKLVHTFLRFSIEYLGFNDNEYRSRASTVYFANTQFKKILNILMGAIGTSHPFWVRQWPTVKRS